MIFEFEFPSIFANLGAVVLQFPDSGDRPKKLSLPNQYQSSIIIIMYKLPTMHRFLSIVQYDTFQLPEL